MSKQQQQQSKRASSTHAVFPIVLYRLLDQATDQGFADAIIGWNSNGTSFKIHNREACVSLLPHYGLKQSHYKSFVRQLNLWGFQCIHGGKKNAERGSYRHEFFQRGRPDLLPKIVRIMQMKPQKPRRSSSKQQQQPAVAVVDVAIPKQPVVPSLDVANVMLLNTMWMIQNNINWQHQQRTAVVASSSQPSPMPRRLDSFFQEQPMVVSSTTNSSNEDDDESSIGTIEDVVDSSSDIDPAPHVPDDKQVDNTDDLAYFSTCCYSLDDARMWEGMDGDDLDLLSWCLENDEDDEVLGKPNDLVENVRSAMIANCRESNLYQ